MRVRVEGLVAPASRDRPDANGLVVRDGEQVPTARVPDDSTHPVVVAVLRTQTRTQIQMIWSVGRVRMIGDISPIIGLGRWRDTSSIDTLVNPFRRNDARGIGILGEFNKSHVYKNTSIF